MSGGSRRTLSGADQLDADARGELGLAGVVDERRKDGPEIGLRARAEARGHALRDAREVAADQLHHLGRERPHRAREARALRDDVVGVAGVDLRHRDHRGLDRTHVPRDDALDRGRDVGRREHRVDARLRPRAVRPAAGDVDVEEGAARHHRPGAHGEAPERHARAGCACRRAPRRESGGTGRPRPSLSPPPMPSSAGWKMK